MNRNSIHISIPKPCHEQWSSMDATAQGAFCHSCQKEVIDFSAMTDREVVEYLAKHQAGCGRFRIDQVDTKLTTLKIDNGFLRWRALFLGVISFLSLKNLIAQSNTKTPTIQSSIPKTELKNTSQNLQTDIIQMKEIQVTSTRRKAMVQGLMSIDIQPPKTTKPILQKDSSSH